MLTWILNIVIWDIIANIPDDRHHSGTQYSGTEPVKRMTSRYLIDYRNTLRLNLAMLGTRGIILIRYMQFFLIYYRVWLILQGFLNFCQATEDDWRESPFLFCFFFPPVFQQILLAASGGAKRDMYCRRL